MCGSSACGLLPVSNCGACSLSCTAGIGGHFFIVSTVFNNPLLNKQHVQLVEIDAYLPTLQNDFWQSADCYDLHIFPVHRPKLSFKLLNLAASYSWYQMATLWGDRKRTLRHRVFWYQMATFSDYHVVTWQKGHRGNQMATSNGDHIATLQRWVLFTLWQHPTSNVAATSRISGH